MAFHRGPRIVEDGLMMYLDVANKKSYPGTGTLWKDLSGNGNHATLVSESGVTGTFDSKYNFTSTQPNRFESRPDPQTQAIDNTDGYFWEVPHNDSLSPNNGNWSVQGWVKIMSEEAPNGTGWFHKLGTGNGIHLEFHGPNYFRINTQTSWSHLKAYDSVLPWNEWNFITVTCQTSGVYGTDFSDVKLYGNGILLDQKDSVVGLDTGQNIWLGRRNGHNKHYQHGDVVNYLYYLKTLTPDQINKNFYATKSRFNI